MNKLKFDEIQPFPLYSGGNLSDIRKQNLIIDFMNVLDSHPEYTKEQICKIINFLHLLLIVLVKIKEYKVHIDMTFQ